MRKWIVVATLSGFCSMFAHMIKSSNNFELSNKSTKLAVVEKYAETADATSTGRTSGVLESLGKRLDCRAAAFSRTENRLVCGANAFWPTLLVTSLRTDWKKDSGAQSPMKVSFPWASHSNRASRGTSVSSSATDDSCGWCSADADAEDGESSRSGRQSFPTAGDEGAVDDTAFPATEDTRLSAAIEAGVCVGVGDRTDEPPLFDRSRDSRTDGGGDLGSFCWFCDSLLLLCGE
ncbi:hypothetical protein Trco_000012 [Trichoderma cornu-damae]|uniref:Uncharacterized protein n=1 Tax=Trichoderma cornu-damae TaxID=654480 RepID=A0A9P8QWJ8_9HYPO|nr:hypothetical protein Trco_000012 [Trichoderma cornu-damae]